MSYRRFDAAFLEHHSRAMSSPFVQTAWHLSIFCKQDVLMVCKRVVNENVGDMMDAA